MADKELKTLKAEIAKMVSVITDNHNVLKEVQSKSNAIDEVVGNIYEHIEDISKKLDFFINMGGHPKKPKAVPKKADTDEAKTKKVPKKAKASSSTEAKAVPKVINNIMTYFKQRYIEDDTYFDEILEEKQAESLFKEHEKVISSKKDDAKQKAAKANLIYKNLTENQRKKVRDKMTDENETISTNNDDDMEEERSD